MAFHGVAPVAVPHAWRDQGAAPVRWLEVRAPIPPAENAFFFPADWKKLG
jgi:hypothetical protein